MDIPTIGSNILKYMGISFDAFDTKKVIGELEKLTRAKKISLPRYYDLWRKHIRDTCNDNTVLSNGWAFATLSGLACFESFVRSDKNVSSIYLDKSNEIGQTVEDVKAQIAKHKINGVIIYGHGNLVRESYFVEKALNIDLLSKSAKIYLLDCSLFYHIFARSPVNYLLEFVPKKRIKPVLVDYFENQKCESILSNIRYDLNVFRPVLHLFLGNTFCNIESLKLKKILSTTVQVGDIVIAEYANYDGETLKSKEPDYVCKMACRAAADLFNVDESKVQTKVLLRTDAKLIEIALHDKYTNTSLTFSSMLRRKFQASELTDGQDSLIGSRMALNSALKIDSYLRLGPPNGLIS